MNEWQKKHPMGTVPGDPLPGAPVLAARGDTVTGVRTIRKAFEAASVDQ